MKINCLICYLPWALHSISLHDKRTVKISTLVCDCINDYDDNKTNV